MIIMMMMMIVVVVAVVIADGIQLNDYTAIAQANEAYLLLFLLLFPKLQLFEV